MVLESEWTALLAELRAARACVEAARNLKRSIDEGFDDIYEGSRIEIGANEYDDFAKALAAYAQVIEGHAALKEKP